MAHPLIEILRRDPYNYDIEQPDNRDKDNYLYDCGDGIKLKVNVLKPTAVWIGCTDSVDRLSKKDFTQKAKTKANSFVKTFSVVKMENADCYNENSQDSEPELSFSNDSKPAGEAKTKQTQLTTISAQPITSGNPYELTFSDEQMKAMMNTVAKGASPSEFVMLMHLAKRYGLDPFLHEIYYVSQMKTIMTSRDGYLKIAQSHKDYRGLHSMAVKENDEFEIDVENHKVIHKFGKGDRGKIIGAWAICYREGRHPIISFAEFSEYKGNSNVWTKYPSAMIIKCAEAFALKRQFGISGLVTREEMDYHNDGDPTVVDAKYVNMDAIDADYEIAGDV
jgi:phage recombination protein Bet